MILITMKVKYTTRADAPQDVVFTALGQLFYVSETALEREMVAFKSQRAGGRERRGRHGVF